MVWSEFHARVHTQLKQTQIVPRSSLLLLAVSGGQDSLCLAQCCLDLADRWNWQLAIGHCDHRWRRDSAENARHVARLAAAWGVPYHQRTAEATLANEAEARSWRYRQLIAIARETQATHIATGHTASDRAETLLHHLLRGAGTDGLSAMTRSRSLDEFCYERQDEATDAPTPRLVRPLFDVFRHETAAFCADRGLSVWDDATNHDQTYTRNRLRHRLLPLLREQFNPKVEAALARTAAALSLDRDCLTAQAAAGLARAIDPERRDRLHRPSLKSLHPAIQRRIIQQWLRQVLAHTPSFDQILHVATLIDAPQTTRTAPIVRSQTVQVCGEWLEIRPVASRSNR